MGRSGAENPILPPSLPGAGPHAGPGVDGEPAAGQPLGPLACARPDPADSRRPGDAREAAAARERGLLPLGGRRRDHEHGACGAPAGLPEVAARGSARRTRDDRAGRAAAQRRHRRGLHRHTALPPRRLRARGTRGGQAGALRKAARHDPCRGRGARGAGALAWRVPDGGPLDALPAGLRPGGAAAAGGRHRRAAGDAVELLLRGRLRPAAPPVEPGPGRRRAVGHRHLQPRRHALGAAADERWRVPRARAPGRAGPARADRCGRRGQRDTALPWRRDVAVPLRLRCGLGQCVRGAGLEGGAALPDRLLAVRSRGGGHPQGAARAGIGALRDQRLRG
ncbi:hypothetical protein OSTOST_11090 [Ostertagia ostertagi]